MFCIGEPIFLKKEILEALKALKDLKIIYKNINFNQLEQTTKLIKKNAKL